MTLNEDELTALVKAERCRPDAGRAHSERVWSGLQARLRGAPAPVSVPKPRGVSTSLVLLAAIVVVGGLASWGIATRSSGGHGFVVTPVPSIVVSAPAPSLPSLALAFPSPGHKDVAKTGTALQRRGSRSDSRRAAQGTMTDELALIEQARGALARGRAGEALGVLAKHKKLFPSGTFLEEAAALRVGSLCKTGNMRAFEAEAERFVKYWPSSVHAESVRRCTRPSDTQ